MEILFLLYDNDFIEKKAACVDFWVFINFLSLETIINFLNLEMNFKLFLVLES